MSGQHLVRVRIVGIGDHVENQSLGVLCPRDQRQPELDQRVEQPVLGVLDPPPPLQIALDRQVGDGAVVAASLAEDACPAGRNEPVADVMFRISAEAIAFVRRVDGEPQFAPLTQGHQRLSRRDIAQPVVAAPAEAVLEMKRLPAVLAFEQLHGDP